MWCSSKKIFHKLRQLAYGEREEGINQGHVHETRLRIEEAKDTQKTQRMRLLRLSADFLPVSIRKLSHWPFFAYNFEPLKIIFFSHGFIVTKSGVTMAKGWSKRRDHRHLGETTRVEKQQHRTSFCTSTCSKCIWSNSPAPANTNVPSQITRIYKAWDMEAHKCDCATKWVMSRACGGACSKTSDKSWARYANRFK
ncbi:hypothetical protein BDV38DRAFT_2645 [Aspergillus pseudotamarii]|uniref:Uncharacterized protein n=1 Tax=Aspergillus pseudotamarii TaxID=132259 RepID=A0A5N6TBT0_ASPPS|nr:uncharacterized protein BDV38DRAFT_2645 [Aspergillus pseudotamarii]KAE8143756.1 hypothetical protein BDV38DRAFT_2645 [Aspergillus pseudotamarii]